MQKEYAKVRLLDAPLQADKEYDYRIPPEWREQIVPGSIVAVPFGMRNYKRQGLVTALAETSDHPHVKNVAAPVDPPTVLSEEMLGLVAYLREHNIKALLIACNTITAYAILPLQKKYPDMPVVGTIIPTTEAAVRTTRNGCIGIIATQATVNSQAYDAELKKKLPEAQVISTACPKLVPLIESGHIGPEDDELYRVAEEYLVPLREKNVDTLIMGCTHYPIIRDVIQKVMGEHVGLIDSGGASAKSLLESLDQKELRAEKSRKGVTKIFCSANRENFLTIANAVQNRDIGADLKQI